MTDPQPPSSLIERRASALVGEALGDTRVVLVTGARQSGKSTLVRQLGQRAHAQWRSLDRAVTRNSAMADPTSFVASSSLMIIDEVQRVPDLLLAIKESVDTDPRPGRYLLTGSARLLSLQMVPDALPGRMETIELWPLSQGEIDGAPDGFVDAAFSGDRLQHVSDLSREDYIARVVRGGFPEAVARSGRRRSAFLDNYVSDIVNRDIIQISQIERGPQLRALIAMLAARPAQLLVPGSLANNLGLPQSTVARYLTLLEEVFLIKRIPAWSRNLSKRSIGTAKVGYVDSGVAANLIDHDEAGLRRRDDTFGGLLEAFAIMEIARQLTWSQMRAEMFHYRTKDGVEVDVVLENRRGQVVAIEVKASATAKAEHFRGIDHLAARLGGDLVAGIVLYLGSQTLPFGDRKLAVPLSALWQL